VEHQNWNDDYSRKSVVSDPMPVRLSWKDYVSHKKFDVWINLQTVGNDVLCTGFSVNAVDNAPINIELYRRIPIINLIKRAKELVLPKPDLDTAQTGAHRGAKLDDDTLMEVARIYKEAHNYGNSPIKSIAKAFAISPSTSAKRVMLARQRGFLGKAIRGRSGEIKE